jgi:hypothetical protein
MPSISAVSSSGEAGSQLVRYQQKLAAGLAAKAADRVIDADQAAVARAEQATRAQQTAAQQSLTTATAATAATAGARLDVTV